MTSRSPASERAAGIVYLLSVAAGVPPAVEPGILPGAGVWTFWIRETWARLRRACLAERGYDGSRGLQSTEEGAYGGHASRSDGLMARLSLTVQPSLCDAGSHVWHRSVGSSPRLPSVSRSARREENVQTPKPGILPGQSSCRRHRQVPRSQAPFRAARCRPLRQPRWLPLPPHANVAAGILPAGQARCCWHLADGMVERRQAVNKPQRPPAGRQHFAGRTPANREIVVRVR